jgi:hypothetical protein
MKVTIENHRGLLRLRFNDGKRRCLLLGVADSPIGRSLALQRKAEIELDWQTGHYDQTLLKYRPRTLGIPLGVYKVCKVHMSHEEQSSAKRQAYSFNFPPDKKEKFAALARSMNRPMAWLLLEAIDRMIESGGAYPANTSASNPSDNVLEAYVSKSGMSEVLEGYMRADDVHSAIDQSLSPV